MFERTIKYANGSGGSFSTTETIEETLELLLAYVKTHGGITEIDVRCVSRPTHSTKDLRDLAGAPTYG